MYASLNINISLWILGLDKLYGSINTRFFNFSQPITMFLVNYNLNFSQSDSYANQVLTSYISGWSVKGTTFLGPWDLFSTFILKYIFDQTSPCQVVYMGMNRSPRLKNNINSPLPFFVVITLLYGWSRQLALSRIRRYDWSVSRIFHSFKFVQNCSKIFW